MQAPVNARAPQQQQQPPDKPRNKIDDISEKLQQTRHFTDSFPPKQHRDGEAGARPASASSHPGVNDFAKPVRPAAPMRQRSASPLLPVRATPNSQNATAQDGSARLTFAQSHRLHSQASRGSPTVERPKTPLLSTPPPPITTNQQSTPTPTPAAPSFYNPAQALKQKKAATASTVTVMASSLMTSASTPTSVTSSVAKQARVSEIPLDRVKTVTSSVDSLVAPAVVIPLEKVVTARSPLRHETPPASPSSGSSVGDVTRAIPLMSTSGAIFTSAPTSPASTLAASRPTAVARKDVRSPRSDASSPDNGGLVIDCQPSPETNNSQTVKPKAIPLERSDDVTLSTPVVTSAPNSGSDAKDGVNNVVSTAQAPSPRTLAIDASSAKKSPVAIDDSLMNEALGATHA